MTGIFIGVGSNIEPHRNVEAALKKLAQAVRVVGLSTVYCTTPIGRPEQCDFWNAVCEVETDMAPYPLKYHVLRRIEDELGRSRSDDKYAARAIDLDILVYGMQVVNEDGLCIPDPDIVDRPFLAIPLCELAPKLIIPGMNMALEHIVSKHCGQGMRALPEETARLREALGLTGGAGVGATGGQTDDRGGSGRECRDSGGGRPW